MADPQGGVRLFPDGTRMGCALVVISSQLLLELITTSRAITDSYTATAPLAIKCIARINAGRYKYIRPLADKHVGRASVSITPEKHQGLAPVLLEYRDRGTSRHHNDRERRHGRNENEKSPGFTTETKAFC